MRQPDTPDGGPPTGTDENFEGWQAVAGAWERRREFVWEASRPVSERMVDLLDPQPGKTLLELAAGPGDTGFRSGWPIPNAYAAWWRRPSSSSWCRRTSR